MMDLNALSVFTTCKYVIPHMIEQQSGKIINISSRAGLRGSAKDAAYSAAKSAVIRLTESMSAELKSYNINVNCILPGTIDTPENRTAMPDRDFNKWVSPASLADIIFFLCSEESRDIHGAAIPVYGKS
jgi:NAD(P)-dependent dehydrogenase (short-subunit alcohol dehydrogenase family)